LCVPCKQTNQIFPSKCELYVIKIVRDLRKDTHSGAIKKLDIVRKSDLGIKTYSVNAALKDDVHFWEYCSFKNKPNIFLSFSLPVQFY